MKRNNALLQKRNRFVNNYVSENSSKQMKVIVAELSEKLFISERTIYNILNEQPTFNNRRAAINLYTRKELN